MIKDSLFVAAGMGLLLNLSPVISFLLSIGDLYVR